MVSSSASTYRDSSMSESTLRDSHASYVTINAEEGQSIPPMLNGGQPYNHVNGEVKFSAGELSEVRNDCARFLSFTLHSSVSCSMECLNGFFIRLFLGFHPCSCNAIFLYLVNLFR